MGPADAEITIQSGPDWARACVAGELDLSSVGPVVEAILAATPSNGRLEVDMRAVTFIDSSGIAGLERCRRRAVALGADLLVRCVDGGAVDRLLGLTGMDRVLQVSAEAT